MRSDDGAGSVRYQSREERRLRRLALSANDKARRLGARGTITAEDLAQLELNEKNCRYCGIELKIGQGSFDHMLAYARGGTNTPQNLARCCLTCQREKFTMTEDEWMAFRLLTVTCKVCKKEWHPRHSEWKIGKAQTCSHACAARWRWMK